MTVDVLFELDADLTFCRLIFDERMFQKLLRARPHCVVFDQTHLHKVVKLLRPCTAQHNHSLFCQLYAYTRTSNMHYRVNQKMTHNNCLIVLYNNNQWWEMKWWHGYRSGVRCKWCIWSSWCHCHPIISWFIKIQSGLIFLVPAYPRCPGKEAVKRVSVIQ